MGGCCSVTAIALRRVAHCGFIFFVSLRQPADASEQSAGDALGIWNDD